MRIFALNDGVEAAAISVEYAPRIWLHIILTLRRRANHENISRDFARCSEKKRGNGPLTLTLPTRTGYFSLLHRVYFETPFRKNPIGVREVSRVTNVNPQLEHLGAAHPELYIIIYANHSQAVRLGRIGLGSKIV